jgi:endonuclease/exonuclease/phosphatase family metal-dependent hydrolase
VGVFPRKSVVAHIEVEGVTMEFAATHLSFGSDQASVREDQLGALRQVLEERRQGAALALIAGDLNEAPTGAAVSAATEAAYRDSWALMHPNNDGPTFPADAPRARIDYLLTSPSAEAAPEIVDAQRFLLSPSDGVYASDHLGVWVELKP